MCAVDTDSKGLQVEKVGVAKAVPEKGEEEGAGAEGDSDPQPPSRQCVSRRLCTVQQSRKFDGPWNNFGGLRGGCDTIVSIGF